ncbi:hypothetical protein CMESO_508 (nucleomorph) [Chroomonas mesostigmatica CCMP1168]|uniref:Uncharacterized protein n=1 Tax=Chroomonas mesostigmatica CCMP1168 TaxID=1195612 RepID=J7G2G1_9CRYP|nr:hypothetical protein CMESO_508 [Chroomonas mesostigmatica CCMP1168]|mmetsp:Transcript_34988/g.86039  ORF Transcript_34988/g.86039 Transcript_34988/m.86039 type:complete len:337 (+) Transcript_34988:181-1191(+)
MIKFCFLHLVLPSKIYEKKICTQKLEQKFIEKNSIFSFKNKIFKKKKFFCMKSSEIPSNTVWEIDFFSRPVLNEDGKKLWELIVVDQKGTFEHIEAIPNNLINSRELKKRINALIEKSPQKPILIKFFRSQMFNMINIALSDLNINVRPSRRTFALFEKISEREENVYPKMSGYRPFMKEVDVNDMLKKVPQKMPDTLRGEKYVFASISIPELESMVNSGINFGQMCPLPKNFDFNQKIPGIVILSERAKSLSSWFDGIELFNIICDLETKNIMIECGLDTQYLFGKFSEETIQDRVNLEPKLFEKNKKKSQGVHFIAVQEYSKKKPIYGIWTLRV